MTVEVLMYCTAGCPYSAMAEELLRLRGVARIVKCYVDREPKLREEMWDRTGRRTVPQIFIGDTHVGGLDELSALDDSGGLVILLKSG